MRATGSGGRDGVGRREGSGGVVWARHTFAVGRLTGRSAEIQLVREHGGAAAAVVLKALVRGSRTAGTVH